MVGMAMAGKDKDRLPAIHVRQSARFIVKQVEEAVGFHKEAAVMKIGDFHICYRTPVFARQTVCQTNDSIKKKKCQRKEAERRIPDANEKGRLFAAPYDRMVHPESMLTECPRSQIMPFDNS